MEYIKQHRLYLHAFNMLQLIVLQCMQTGLSSVPHCFIQVLSIDPCSISPFYNVMELRI